MAKKKPPNFTDEPGPVLHTARWRFGEFELDEGKRELSRAGQAIELEPKPFNMLMLMLRHPGELITKNDLMEALWTGRIVTESVLSNCAAKLRSVLGEESPSLRLRTIHGYGYRLEANPELITPEAPPPAEPPAFAPEQPVPFRPNWQLKRRLGVSGETWLAEQPLSGEQRVFKFALTPRSLSALKREVTLYRLLRQTLEAKAPVVDIVDWNFDEPPWFIETEYCELGSLAEYLDSLGGAKALPLEARLGLVIQLAEALAQVHGVGILHKDLKPANILISPRKGGEVQLRLGDFGAGRLLDYSQLDALAITRLGFTQFNESGGASSSSSGTPLYYAPEVLSGQPLTLKADIYALGVIFYQLVVGDMRRLFAPGWEAGVEDELLREDIADCAAGDPYLRLSGTQLLAQRLRALAVRRRERALQRAEREAAATALQALKEAHARRKGLQLAAAALGLGLVTSLLLFWNAQVARVKAETATKQALTLRNFVLDDVLGDLAKGDEPATRLTVGQLLNFAAGQAKSRFQSTPELEAQIRLQLGNAMMKLGLRVEASREFYAALEKSKNLQQNQPLVYSDLVTSILVNDYNLSRAVMNEELFIRLHETCKRLLSDSHPSLARQYVVLGLVKKNKGDLAGALRMTTSAIAAARKDPDYSARSLHSLERTLGTLFILNGDFTAARETLTETYRNVQSSYGRDHEFTAMTAMTLADAQIKSGRYLEAQLLLKDALRIAKRWEPTPGELTVSVYNYFSEEALARKDIPAAREYISLKAKAVELASDELQKRNDYLSFLQAQLAASEKRWPEVLVLARQAKRQYVLPDGNYIFDVDLFVLFQKTAQAHIALGQWFEASAELDALDHLMAGKLPKLHPLNNEQQRLRAQLAKRIT